MSNINYLKALVAAGFRIHYIHNGLIPREAVTQLKFYCEQVVCRENIGQDMGGWKDAYLCCHEEGDLDGIEWLLFCNDSNFFLGGPCSSVFVDSFSSLLERVDLDLVALNKNYELWQHYQSYFLCFNRKLFSKSRFHRFWRDYLPLNHRYHAINNGEIRLTRDVIDGSRAEVLYGSAELYDAINSSPLPVDQFFTAFPKGALYLAGSTQDVHVDQDSRARSAVRNRIDPLSLQRIMAILDMHNPSHAYALLFIRYLYSPFLKKDLLRHGVFSLPQIAALLADSKLLLKPDIISEVLSTLSAGGMNISYIRFPRQAYRKGINAVEGSTFAGYGNLLKHIGL